MLKKLSIRIRLTLLSTLLLTVCCIGLTIILNFSAYRLANKIDASIIAAPVVDSTLPETNSYDRSNMETVPSYPAKNLQEAKRGFSLESTVYMIVIILGGSALTYYISGRALKPLEVLNTKIKNINVHNLSESLDIPPTKDEIAELTQSFNEMTNKLDKAFLTQKCFSSSAAHELRTPLAVLQTKVDVFRKKSSHSNHEYESLIFVFEKQITRLRGIVSNLLDMTNLDDEREQSCIHLKDLLEDIISELSIIAKYKNISISLNCDEIFVFGNLELLYRAFYNIIENGIKYNIADGYVNIQVKKISENHAEILIKDGGIGIPNEMKKHIFQPFYRVDKSRSREMGGAGLGLSIVDSIISKHKGTITVSDNEKEGTCFKIIL